MAKSTTARPQRSDIIPMENEARMPMVWKKAVV